MKILAFVELDDTTNTAEPIAPGAVISISHIKAVDPATFAQHWNLGIDARKNWDKFCENFIQLIVHSGIVDEHGEHIEEYNPGSLCQFVLDNQTMIPKDFRESYLGRIALQAIKGGAAGIGKGKVILIDWKTMIQYAGPMTESVLHMLEKSPQRKQVIQPLLDKYFAPPAVLPVAPTDN